MIIETKLNKMHTSVQNKELNNRKILTLDVVRAYFAHLNPVAVRISTDIDETRIRYGQLWCTLRINEQNAIINESLINPEITMKYFKQCSRIEDTKDLNTTVSTSTSPLLSSSSCGISSCSHSYFSSTENIVLKHKESIASVVLNSISCTTKLYNSMQSRSENSKKNIRTSKAIVESKTSIQFDKQRFINTYAFDGQNLKSFSLRDELDAYCDEHSYPFNYHTKSQINLRLFHYSGETLSNEAVSTKKRKPKNIPVLEKDDGQISSIHIEPVSLTDHFEKQLQKVLDLDIPKVLGNRRAIYSSMKYKTNYTLFNKANDIINEQCLSIKPTFNDLKKHVKTDNLDAKIVNDRILLTNVTYYSSSYSKVHEEECITLMQQCDSSINSECSEIEEFNSAFIESKQNDDEHLLHENSRLTNDNIYLQKEYDFLNNW